LFIFIHSLINSKSKEVPQSPPVIKHASFQLMTVMMYVPPCYCAVKREVTMTFSLGSHKSMDIPASVWTPHRGRSRKFRKGGRALATHVDTIYFSKNRLTIIQNFTEKGVTAVHSAHP